MLSGRSAKCLDTAAQHYLMHLLREKMSVSHSRIVVVSSGLIRSVKEDDIGVFVPCILFFP